MFSTSISFISNLESSVRSLVIEHNIKLSELFESE
jgi:hypothetical protein